MDFTCKCGKTSTSYAEITPETICGDCIEAEVKADEPRRKAKIESLVEELKQKEPLTHSEARTATTTSSFRMNATDIGHRYLSELVGKSIPFYTHNMVARVGENCVVNNCLLNGLWPWARYQRDSGDYAYICLYVEPQ